jgi:hypothetical protein
MTSKRAGKNYNKRKVNDIKLTDNAEEKEQKRRRKENRNGTRKGTIAYRE